MNHPTQPDANRPYGSQLPLTDTELEQRLRQALRPVSAPSGLAEKIVRAAAPPRRATAPWLRYAMAAAVLLSTAASVRFWQQRQEELARQETGRQLAVAFMLTSEKIQLGQSKVAGKLKLVLKPLEGLPHKGL